MNYKNILKRIRIKNILNLFFPTVVLIMIIIFCINVPVTDVLRPLPVKSISDLANVYSGDITYVNITADNLYDTGVTYIRNGKTAGHYYYILDNNYCYIFLLSSKHINDYIHKNGADISVLNDINIRAAIINSPKMLKSVIEHISRELSWTYTGISENTAEYIISEPDYPYLKNVIIFYIILFLTIMSAVFIIYSVVCICCPYLYKNVYKLHRYGNVKMHMRKAEKELNEKILFRKKDIFITENYIMDFSAGDFKIMPVNKIVWVYKFSSYHRIIRYKNRKITYTLCLYGEHNVSLISPYRLKTDADRILSYLSLYYPDILFGYSREYEKIAKQKR